MAMIRTEYVKLKNALSVVREFECVDEKEAYLGSGAFGEVVKARCMKKSEHRGKMFAIKIMDHKEGNEDQKEKQYREIEALIRFTQSNHSNVIQYFQSWKMQVGDIRKLCIQMELCSCNLNTLVRRYSTFLTQDSPRFYEHVFRQILDGLVFIHSSGWVHRDIHPGNILVVNQNPQRISDIHIKIGDFGLARYIRMKISEDSDWTNKAENEKLTPLYRQLPIQNFVYIAPELTTDTYDFKVDVYSAGIVLLYISCYPILHLSNLKEEVQAIKEGKRDINDLIYFKTDKKLTTLIKYMLKNKEQRPNAREAKEYMFPKKIEFFVRKGTDKDSRMCSLSELTIAALRTAVRRRTRVSENRQEIKQERMGDDGMMTMLIELDEDVEFVFRNAEQEVKQNRYVHLIVIEKAEDDHSNIIQASQSGPEDVEMKSQSSGLTGL